MDDPNRLPLSERLIQQGRQEAVDIIDARIRYWDERGSVLARGQSQELRYIRDLLLSSTVARPSSPTLI